jgi:hypothetical protein
VSQDQYRNGAELGLSSGVLVFCHQLAGAHNRLTAQVKADFPGNKTEISQVNSNENYYQFAVFLLSLRLFRIRVHEVGEAAW